MGSTPAPAHRRFFRALAVRVGADVLNLVLRMTLLSVVTRSLGVRDYGIFSQGLTTAVVLLPLFSLRLNTACTRFFPELAGDRAALRARFTLTLVLILVAGGAGVLLAALAARPVAAIAFGDVAQASMVPLVVALAVMQAITIHAIDFFRAVNQTEKSSALGIVRAGLTLGGAWYALHRHVGVSELLTAFFVVDALLGAAIVLRILQTHPGTSPQATARASLAPYLRYALPLVPYSLLIAANAMADRYFITHLLGVEEAGRYAFSYGLVSAAMMMSNAIAYVIYPQLSLHWAQHEHAQLRALLARGQSVLLYFAIPIGCGLTLIYPDLVDVMARGSFVLDRSVIVLLVVGHVFLGLYAMDVYLIELAKGTTWLLAVLVCATIINLALNAVWIPRMGMRGAALATMLTYLAQWLAVRALAASVVRIRVPFASRLVVTSLVGAAVMVPCVRALRLDHPVANLTLSIAVGGAVYLGLTGVLAGTKARAQLLGMFSRGGGG